MAEGARLESVYTATYPGFESPPHRHILRRARTQVRAFFSHISQPGGDEKPGPGFDYWRSQLDRLRAQRTGCPQGERSESIPASPPYFKKSSYASTGFFFRIFHSLAGMRSPDRVRLLAQPVGQTESAANRLPAGRAKRVNPRLTAIFKRRARTQVRAFFSHISQPGGDEKPGPGSTTGAASWTD